MASLDKVPSEGAAEAIDRRTFLSTSSSLMMAGGLVSSYGTFAYFSGRFLYPASDLATGWMFVGQVVTMKKDVSIDFKAPNGAKMVITRLADSGTVADFRALSRVCPHLGCHVHWEPHNNRFFCPCHNGVFDAEGKATHGPPADASQSLPEYQLKIEDGLLFVEVPLESVACANQNPEQVVIASSCETYSPRHEA